ncbi:hypothetical protein, partial [Mesorhizobium sp.]
MKPDQRARKWIEKKAKKGEAPTPPALSPSGPDNVSATKLAVGIVRAPHSEPTELRRWLMETGDMQKSGTIFAEIAAFLKEREVHSVVMADRIIGCPHEEAIDYLEGGVCPHCPYWAGGD